MIADRHVVLVAGYHLPAEVRAEIERLGALVVDIGDRDPALSLRHLAHALRARWPMQRTNSPIREPAHEPDAEPSADELADERELMTAPLTPRERP